MLAHDKNQLITGHFNAQIYCMTDVWEEVKRPESKTPDGHWLLNLCAEIRTG